MSRRSRLRTFAARASLTMLVALVVVWAGSAWVQIYFPLSPQTAIRLMEGLWGIVRGDRGTLSQKPIAKILRLESGALSFWFEREWGPGHKTTYVPMWVFIVPLASVTALIWRSELTARRRARAGLCPTCRYDLAATPTGVPCPECGTPTSTTTAAPINATPPTA